MSETSHSRFQRLATKRVNKALKAIQLIGNLSNRAIYDYQSGEVDKILSALTEEIRICRQRFNANDKKTPFKL